MFLQLREEAAAALEAALEAEGYATDDLGLEEPPEDLDAALASSVAFRLAGEAGAPPPQVAAELADATRAETDDCADLAYVGGVEAAGPYVNFQHSERYLAETLASAAGDDEFGHLPDREESVVVEHTSANPTGPVHVGRARNPIIGDAIVRLLSYAGYDVDAHYYVNDAGRQIATFTWAYEAFDEDDLEAAGYGEPEREKPDYDLVRYYRLGNEVLEEGDPEAVEAAEAEIEAIMRGLEDGDEATFERTSEVVDAVLEGMRESLERLPAEFDEFVKETRFLFDGSVDDVVDRLQELEAAVYEEDAWQLDCSAHGIDKNLVFLRSDGTSLYATRDLAHHEWKFEAYDRAVTVLGEDHGLQADQLRTALELLGRDTDQLDQVLYSYVNLPDGKMSTRRGTGVDLDDLLDEAVERAREEYEDRAGDRLRDDDLDPADVERIARQVGVGAVRFDVVSKQASKQITFEWDRALDFEAQSAPYVQYAHARCCGILDEARNAGLSVADAGPSEADADAGPTAADADARSRSGDLEAVDPAGADPSALETDEARELLRRVARFPAVVEEAADELEPHAVATYVRRLADQCNAFYRACPVLDAEGETQRARLATVVAARTALANGLDVLGVEAPDSM